MTRSDMARHFGGGAAALVVGIWQVDDGLTNQYYFHGVNVQAFVGVLLVLGGMIAVVKGLERLSGKKPRKKRMSKYEWQALWGIPAFPLALVIGFYGVNEDGTMPIWIGVIVLGLMFGAFGNMVWCGLMQDRAKRERQEARKAEWKRLKAMEAGLIGADDKPADVVLEQLRHVRSGGKR